MKTKSHLKAIRFHCLTCAGSAAEVSMCDMAECTLHEFRFGKNPFYEKTDNRNKRKRNDRGEVMQK